MMVATTVTLVIMVVVVSMFALVTANITDSRATIEMAEQLRSVQRRLQLDLAGLTVTMDPPRRPEWGEGYFEYIEGADFYPHGNYSPPEDRKTMRVDVDADGQVIGMVHPDNMAPALVNDPTYFDSTLGDHDVLMFTTRSHDEPFVGLAGPNGQTTQSQFAEVRWFVRGRTLYRGQRLVRPDLILPTVAIPYPNGYYAEYDVAVHQVGPGPTRQLLTSTLGDLTKREHRFAHQPLQWPHDARFWRHLGLPTMAECSHADWPYPFYDPSTDVRNVPNRGDFVVPEGMALMLDSPTSFQNDSTLQLTQTVDPGTNQPKVFDPWENSIAHPEKALYPWDQVDAATGILRRDMSDPTMLYAGPRSGEDVIATNVVSFDVKLWDPGAPIFEGTDESGNPLALLPGDPGYQDMIDNYNMSSNTPTPIGYGAYVDLGYAPNYFAPAGAPQPTLNGIGHPKSGLQLLDGMLVYDTGSFDYERDGIPQNDNNGDGRVDENDRDPGTNGLDDNVTFDVDGDGIIETGEVVQSGGVDDSTELEAPPPYPVPVKSMQIKIRVFEPDTRQIREVTIVHQFAPQ